MKKHQIKKTTLFYDILHNNAKQIKQQYSTGNYLKKVNHIRKSDEEREKGDIFYYKQFKRGNKIISFKEFNEIYIVPKLLFNEKLS